MKTARLILTPEQTQLLAMQGVTFGVIAPGSHPDAAGVSVLHIVPIDKPTADSAISVALGQATARKKRQPDSDR